MNKQELLDNLPNFYGTENYHRYSSLFRNVLLTDGAKFLAENAGGGAYWLMDCISSHIPSIVNANDTFAVARLFKARRGFTLIIEDGNETIYAKQTIEYSDFPLDEIALYVIRQPVDGKNYWLILLSSEY